MFKRFVLQLPQEISLSLIEHARREVPNECCGLLAGHPDGRVTHALPLVNRLESPVQFESEPRSMFEAMKQMRKLGIEMLAVYHSHPLSHPMPSRIDWINNYSDYVQNLIIGKEKDEWQLQSWWITSGLGFERAEMVIEKA